MAISDYTINILSYRGLKVDKSLYLTSKLQFSENFQLGSCPKGQGHMGRRECERNELAGKPELQPFTSICTLKPIIGSQNGGAQGLHRGF